MKRKRHTPEEIIKKLREADGLLAGGKSVEEACRALGVSAPTYHRWKSHYGGVKKDALKRLREWPRNIFSVKSGGWGGGWRLVVWLLVEGSVVQVV
jgi:transposase-like protein